MKKILSTILFISAIPGVVFAQRGESLLRASISGQGGDGKCTIEVNIDDVAVVEIRGDEGRLITVSGQPAQWRRFQCNQRMPFFPANFRFIGIDGRGRQTLMRDPASNRGTAVIRLEDSKGGREGYTFDLVWRGGSDGPGYHYDETPRRDIDRDRDRRDERRDNRPILISCNSNDGYRKVCEVDTRGGVVLLKQREGSLCREGTTWGYDRRGIWVDRGCRADFEVRVSRP